jgi:hypothetical protein
MVKQMKNSKKEKQKRTPCTILPYTMLVYVIQCILLHPGKWDDFQHCEVLAMNLVKSPPQLRMTGFNLAAYVS